MSSAIGPVTVPAELAVLRLPHPLILHPSLVLAVAMPYAHALALLRAALATSTAATPPGEQPSPAGKRTIVVAALPSSPAAEQSSSAPPHVPVPAPAPAPGDWACAARLLRLIRHPAGDQCTLLVMGLSRVQVGKLLPAQRVSLLLPAASAADDGATHSSPSSDDGDGDDRALVPARTQHNHKLVDVIQATVYDATQLSPLMDGDEALVNTLRSSAHELLDALSSFSLLPPLAPAQDGEQSREDTKLGAGAMPYVPPTLIKRLRGLVHEVQDEGAPVLADVLAGSVGGACAWPVRRSLLAAAEPRSRVEAVAYALHQGAERIRDTRQVLDALLAPLNSDSRETLLRLQMQSLVASMAAVTPTVSARLTTPKGTFVFNTGAPTDRTESDRGAEGRDPEARRRALSADALRLLNSLRNNALKRSSSNASRPPLPSGSPPGSSADDDAEQDEEQDEVAELSAKLTQTQLSSEARKVCDRELKRLSRIPSQSVERGVLVSYLELMAELPWDRTTSDLPAEEQAALGVRAEGLNHIELDALLRQDETEHANEGIVDRAKRILNADHYGLDKIKKRLVEYLAVLELKTLQAQVSVAPAPQSAPPKAELQASAAQLQERLEDHVELDSRQPVEPPRKLHIVDKGPILLLVGPPGTGKTSIARSLATALRRPFTRLSLGGVRDEAEIRGHRRTYVGAMPGSIVSSLRKVGVSDPVMLLDEVDKLGSGNGLHGDPMAAMLEVLDPEQNNKFTDHYVNCPVDLSRVLFVATANSLDTIAPPLLDRTEVIEISGYTHDEKVAIAKQYLVPKQRRAAGLAGPLLQVPEETLLKVASSYTREAGVRTLERQVAAIARGKAVQYAEAVKPEVEAGGARAQAAFRSDAPVPPGYDPIVRVGDLEGLLGLETYEPELADVGEERPAGVVTGLAYQGSGNGGILHIETALMPASGAGGALHLTGSLGDVIKESAELAFAWVKAHAFELGILPSRTAKFFPGHDVHLHMPSGAVPKDGPSAGAAFVTGLVSLLSRVPTDPMLAMTGEMTLRGKVTAVGGIKEKLLGAHRAGIRKVIVPARNRKDVEADLPVGVLAELAVVYAHNIWDVLEAALGLPRLEDQQRREPLARL